MSTEASRLRVRQLRGVAGRPWQQRLVLAGLGLRGPGSEVVVENARAMRGMIRKVLHLVSVADASVEGAAAKVESASAAAQKPKAKAKASAKGVKQ